MKNRKPHQRNGNCQKEMRLKQKQMETRTEKIKQLKQAHPMDGLTAGWRVQKKVGVREMAQWLKVLVALVRP